MANDDVMCGEPAEIQFASRGMPHDGELRFCPAHALGVLRGTRAPGHLARRFRWDEVFGLDGRIIQPPVS